MISERNPHLLAIGLLLCAALTAMLVAGCGANKPSVTGSSPNQGSGDVAATPAHIQLTFDQAMDKSSVEGASGISPDVPGGVSYEWSDDGKTLTAHYGGPFAPETHYTFTVGASAQADNGAELGEDYKLDFTTAEAPPPAKPSAAAPPAAPPGSQRIIVEQKQTAPPPQPGAQQPVQQPKPAAPSAKPATGGGGPAADTDSDSQPSTSLTFTKDIAPIAKNRCSQCHSTKMSDYTQVKSLVVPGNPAKSLYYTKAIGQGKHPGGNRWKEKADTVKQWIQAGAPQ